MNSIIFGAKVAAIATIGAMVCNGTAIAQAADLGLPARTVGLQTVSGRFVSVQNAGGGASTLTLAFEVGSCADQLLPVSYTTEKRGNQLSVYISGINAQGDTTTVRCAPGPYIRQATLRVPGTGYNANRIKVVNLTQLGTVGN
jgi:hypothetical protein